MINYMSHFGSNSSPANEILRDFKPREVRLSGRVLTTTPAFDAYWYFAWARQELFHTRISDHKTSEVALQDQVLRSYRFTNAYRASDRVSQYLIKNVIGSSATAASTEDLFFKILLFKIFNKIETWEALCDALGPICLDRFDLVEYDRVLTDRQEKGFRNYSAAYIMPSAGGVFGHKRKHSNHLALIEWMLENKFPDRLRQFASMSDGYSLLLSAPSLGPFLAYQFVTDINYSCLTDFSEMEFVVAGPGAHDGISKCFESTQGVPAESIIKYMADHQSDYFTLFGHSFRDLWGRQLQLIDCQNLFCEISKYTRVAFPDLSGISGRSRIKQKYQQNRLSIERPVYPEKWGINHRIAEVHDFKNISPVTTPDGHIQADLFD